MFWKNRAQVRAIRAGFQGMKQGTQGALRFKNTKATHASCFCADANLLKGLLKEFIERIDLAADFD